MGYNGLEWVRLDEVGLERVWGWLQLGETR